jgi:hypothetical protein
VGTAHPLAPSLDLQDFPFQPFSAFVYTFLFDKKLVFLGSSKEVSPNQEQQRR